MIKKELLLASWLEKLQKKWDNEEYYYDVEEATKVFKFVSKLTNDRGASRQFELLEFQFEIITEILCVKRRSDGKRKHREAHINIPRKNGKSFLAAIIVVYLFFCQRHIFGALFILTANTTKQAGELYATVEHFIKTNKTLRRYCKITSSTKTIVRKDNGNKLMVLSSDADNADSFNDYVAVLDEIHQAKNDEMYGKLRTGQGAWDEPLIMTITTASSGEDPANPEMQLYTMAKKIEAGEVNDPSFYYRIYEADKDCNVEDEAQWYKSNPALGVFRKQEDLANYAKRIRLMPLQENMFRRMFLSFNFVSKTPDVWAQDLRKVKKWLYSGKDNRLILSDDPEYYYKVKKAVMSDTERTAKRKGKFEIVFTCESYMYRVDGQDEKEIGEYLYNPYMKSQPVYKIYGNGGITLEVNGNQVTAEVTEQLNIDTKLEICYNAANEISNAALTGKYEGLYLQEGDNNFKYTEGFKVVLVPNWREL